MSQRRRDSTRAVEVRRKTQRQLATRLLDTCWQGAATGQFGESATSRSYGLLPACRRSATGGMRIGPTCNPFEVAAVSRHDEQSSRGAGQARASVRKQRKSCIDLA